MNSHYAELQAGIEALAKLHPDDEHFIDKEVALSSLAFLNFLAQYKVPPPQIFSHGGDALAFKWDFPSTTRYVSVDHGIASFRERARGKKIGPVTKFRIASGAELMKLLTPINSIRCVKDADRLWTPATQQPRDATTKAEK